MSEQEPRNPVSLQRLDLTALDPEEDREFVIAVVWREKREKGGDETASLGPIVKIEVTSFPVRESLPIPTMTSLLRLEAGINESLADTDEEANRAVERGLDRAHAKIVQIITDRSPGAFDEREIDGKTCVGSLELDTAQILMALAWIAGDTSVADAVAKTLTAGRSSAQTIEEVAAEAAERGEPLGPEGEATGPLVSSTPS